MTPAPTQSEPIAAWACGPGVAALPPPALGLIRRAFLDTIAVSMIVRQSGPQPYTMRRDDSIARRPTEKT